MVVEVGYAQGWDPESRAVWRTLSVGEARERDTAGLPYVVVYRTAGRHSPLEVRLVSWRDHHVGLWVYDDMGRRTYDLDLRLLDDPARLFHRYSVAWNYPDQETAGCVGQQQERLSVDSENDRGLAAPKMSVRSRNRQAPGHLRVRERPTYR
ncbi:hypothetical protein ACFW7J_04780 [Streptomyces sp. NPDC059525]|uniref:hypothetical protein n=1 Tax=Streptomyces sp. NPDC059525 TaxID=3346857 RepID=UPI0036C9B264